jgi:hypothetical protein
MHQNHSLLSSRFELKYIIPQRIAVGVRHFVRNYLELDEYGSPTGNHSYPVHSLYLDSPDQKIYARTLNGDRNRFKLRVRYYTEDPATPVFWEVKRREKDVIIKTRCAIRRTAAGRVLAGHLPTLDELSFPGNPAEQAAIQEFFRLQFDLNAVPAMHVAYEREAYVLPANNEFRVTMDRSIRVCPRFDGGLGTHMESPFVCTGSGEAPDDAVVLELKFAERFPDWYRELVQRFNLTQGGAAKYAEGFTCYLGRDLAAADVVRNLVL